MIYLAIPSGRKGGIKEREKSRKAGLEKLRPGSAAAQKNALRDWHSVTRRTEKGGSVPALWTPRTFSFWGDFSLRKKKGEEQHNEKNKKFWQSTMQRYREGAALYKKRTHWAVGFTCSWSGLGLATLCSFGRVCAASADGR